MGEERKGGPWWPQITGKRERKEGKERSAVQVWKKGEGKSLSSNQDGGGKKKIVRGMNEGRGYSRGERGKVVFLLPRKK